MPMDERVNTGRFAAAEQPAGMSNASPDNISRRKALGRMVVYTAPAMLALLASEPAMAGS